MGHYFSRRAFVRSASGLIIGAVAANQTLINTLRTAYAVTSPAQWMASLGDDTKISGLTIPGTHDTCALYGGPLVACQDRSLAELLAAGIRFVDIRCRHIGNAFAIHHDRFFQQLMFGSGVRDVCINFLKANPSECIVMSIKEEYTPTGNTRTFEDTFDSYVRGLESFWYLGDSIPTLSNVRGKIVLLRRFAASRLPKGIGAASWPDNTTFQIQTSGETLKIQDNYKVTPIFAPDINKKWEEIKNLLDRAKSDVSNAWYINFASGAYLLAYPRAIAARINPSLFNYLGASFTNRLGTLVMDFPDNKLINRIIDINSSTLAGGRLA